MYLVVREENGAKTGRNARSPFSRILLPSWPYVYQASGQNITTPTSPPPELRILPFLPFHPHSGGSFLRGPVFLPPVGGSGHHRYAKQSRMLGLKSAGRTGMNNNQPTYNALDPLTARNLL